MYMYVCVGGGVRVCVSVCVYRWQGAEPQPRLAGSKIGRMKAKYILSKESMSHMDFNARNILMHLNALAILDDRWLFQEASLFQIRL